MMLDFVKLILTLNCCFELHSLLLDRHLIHKLIDILILEGPQLLLILTQKL
jgi:hypothetical protein